MRLGESCCGSSVIVSSRASSFLLAIVCAASENCALTSGQASVQWAETNVTISGRPRSESSVKAWPV